MSKRPKRRTLSLISEVDSDADRNQSDIDGETPKLKGFLEHSIERSLTVFINSFQELVKNPSFDVPWIDSTNPLLILDRKTVEKIVEESELTAIFAALPIKEKIRLLSSLAPEENHTQPKKYDSVPLWSDRTTGREVTAVDFIKTNYGNKDCETWNRDGLTLADLRHDKPLYNAYVQRIRRHPDEDLGLPKDHSTKRIDDPTEAIERRRASDRESNKRYRNKQLDL